MHYHPDVEQVLADEQETIEQLNSAFDIILERTAQDYGHAVRSVHAKSHGVLDDSPNAEHAAASALANAASFTTKTEGSMMAKLVAFCCTRIEVRG